MTNFVFAEQLPVGSAAYALMISGTSGLARCDSSFCAISSAC